eukprot:scaffold988_cov165-Ochromonas_danica.AAC.35
MESNSDHRSRTRSRSEEDYVKYLSSNTSPCTLVLLMGLKGSGKTTVGEVLEKRLGIKYLAIEPIYKDISERDPSLQGYALEQKVYQRVLDDLDGLALAYPTLCIETTGVALTFQKLLGALQEGYRVILVRIHAPPERCLERARSCSRSFHLPAVNEDHLREINEKAAKLTLPWEIEIDNTNHEIDEEAIVEAVRKVLVENDNDRSFYEV